MSALVCVAGGEGFVLRRAAEALVDRGVPVRAVLGPSVSEQSEAWLRALGAEVLRADVATAEGAARACEGASSLVYAPGVVSELRSARAWELRCVVATEELLDAARARGVRRMVFVSSELVTLGPEPRKYVEDTFLPPAEPVDGFVKALALGEDLALSAHGPRVETLALRPGHLWGPGEQANARRWVARARAGAFSWVAGGAALLPTTYGATLGAAVVGALAADAAEAGGTAYYVTDDERVTVRRFFTQWFGAVGVRGPRGRVPEWLARASAYFDRASEQRDRAPDAAWTRAEILSLARGGYFNSKRARAQLRWAPSCTIDEGMRAFSAHVARVGGVDAVCEGTTLEARSVTASPVARGELSVEAGAARDAD